MADSPHARPSHPGEEDTPPHLLNSGCFNALIGLGTFPLYLKKRGEWTRGTWRRAGQAPQGCRPVQPCSLQLSIYTVRELGTYEPISKKTCGT